MIKRSRFFLMAGLSAMVLLVSVWGDDDPPGRIARLNYFDGTVTFSPAGTDDWSYATLNRPLTTGDRLWSDRGSRAELHTGGMALRLGAETSVDFLALDDDVAQMKLGQGTLNFHVRDLWEGESVEVDTPNLAFVVRHAGEFRLTVDPRSNTTTVAIEYGEGAVTGNDGYTITLSEGETIRFSGLQLAEADARDEIDPDAFDAWVSERDRREDRSASVRYVSRDMVGYEDLDDYGEWHVEAGYGTVWSPRVVVHDWAPYRYGHWSWIAPWGWTWVDDAPWGFAPFHYGRWAWAGSRWCWVPGPIGSRPVYAPALVAFAGHLGGVRVGVSIGAPVAWFPLAPGEVYRPAYRASDRYLTRVNNVANGARIHTSLMNSVYINQRLPNALTAMPANNFVLGRPAQHSGTQVSPGMIQTVQAVGAPSLAPVRQSLIGAAKPATIIAPIGGRPVVATRAPLEPPALHDRMAQQPGSLGAPAGSTPIAQVPQWRQVRQQVNVVRPVQPGSQPAQVRGQSPDYAQGNGVRAQPGSQRDIGSRDASAVQPQQVPQPGRIGVPSQPAQAQHATPQLGNWPAQHRSDADAMSPSAMPAQPKPVQAPSTAPMPRPPLEVQNDRRSLADGERNRLDAARQQGAMPPRPQPQPSFEHQSLPDRHETPQARREPPQAHQPQGQGLVEPPHPQSQPSREQPAARDKEREKPHSANGDDKRKGRENL